MRSLKVADIMSNHIEPIRCGTPLNIVVNMLLQNHISGLPVVDERRRVLGFVSEQDCIHALLVSNYHREGEPLVDDVMFQEPVVVSPEMAVVDLAQNLGKGRPKVFPVVEQDRLVGIITRGAILERLARSNSGMEVPKSDGAD